MPSLKQVNATVLAGLGMREVIGGEGLEVVELGWWKSTRVGPLTIHFVPSQHWSRRGVFDENKTLWGGFVIEGSSARLYHSGDTAYFEGFKMIGERFPDIDAAMLPIGAYDPEWFMTRQHMNPEQATQAFLDLNARDFLAMHWGTFKLTDEPLGEPPVRLEAEWKRRELPAEKRRVLAIGESFTVRRPAAPASR
jgi:L-ascorbate metabolism protein UlaG (beta-lactamase superfamily)